MALQPPLNKKLWVVWAVTVIVEVLGISVVSAGIGVEIALKADLGFVLITGGGLLVAAGGAIYAKFLRVP